MQRLTKGAELVAAILFAAMFGAFVIQVVSRYVFNDPVSWTLEVCSITYIWIVFFAGAFVVEQRQHITFDMLYKGVRPRWRRIFAIVNVASLVGVFIAALPGTIDYILYKGRETSLILNIRMDLLYSCFGLFMVGAIVAALLRLQRLAGRHWQDAL